MQGTEWMYVIAKLADINIEDIQELVMEEETDGSKFKGNDS